MLSHRVSIKASSYARYYFELRQLFYELTYQDNSLSWTDKPLTLKAGREMGIIPADFLKIYYAKYCKGPIPSYNDSSSSNSNSNSNQAGSTNATPNTNGGNEGQTVLHPNRFYSDTTKRNRSDDSSLTVLS